MIVPRGVTAIAAGLWHSLFIMSDGSLWAMGANDVGQLGDGTYNNTNRPQRIVASGVTAVAGGAEHTLFIKAEGSLWATGQDSFGQLGDGNQSPNNLFFGVNRPERIVAGAVTAVAAGYWHSLFLKRSAGLSGLGS